MDNEPAATFTISSTTVTETAAGVDLPYVITLSNPSSTPTTITIVVTNTGTATAGSDYTVPTTLTVTIPANQLTATFNVSVLDDNVTESSETVIVTATLGATTLSATGTIEDNDNGGCELEFFNALTPSDQDGSNDTFIIENIGCYPNNSLEIYNRWGVLVFETQGYDNVNNTFKGISNGRVNVKQSDELPAGTYFYILKYADKGNQFEPKAGYLYINR